MKKFLLILFGSIVTLVLIVVAGYFIRKQQASKQFVSAQSTAILSIAVDELILDNLGTLLKPSDKAVVGKEPSSSKAKNFFFNSGLAIPARIFLFSVPQHGDQLFGILPVSNYEKCLAYFMEEHPDGLELLDKSSGTVSVKLSKHMRCLFNKEYLVYGISQLAELEVTQLSELISKSDSLVPVNTLKNSNPEILKAHIAYSRIDQSLNLSAQINNQKIKLDGDWQLATTMPKQTAIRKLDTTGNVLSFWSSLPLSEIPALGQFLGKYSALSKDSLAASYGGYVDLEVKAGKLMQTDTILTYDYDDNFNPIEQKEIREVEVPHIVHVWSNSKGIGQYLPDNMFYHFNKKEENGYVLNSTTDLAAVSLTQLSASYPLFLQVDFTHWPDQWTLGPIDKLKQRQLKLSLQAEYKGGKRIQLKGVGTWK